MLKTIVFEDHGQDFLEWDIGIAGNVIDCRPFQAAIWVNKKVLNEDVNPGGFVRFISRHGEELTIKYPVKEVIINQGGAHEVDKTEQTT